MTTHRIISMLAVLLLAASGATTAMAFVFSTPRGVAVDGKGNVYVADAGNNAIFRISQTGVVTTLAGVAGTAGSDDGSGGAARFNEPCGLCVDRSGNVYVADRSNHTVRRITPDGRVTTLAGDPNSGPPMVAGGPWLGNLQDGTGAAARFVWPAGVAVDTAGNVYVADYGNNAIRRIAPDGAVTTLAGGPHAAARSIPAPPGGAGAFDSGGQAQSPGGPTAAVPARTANAVQLGTPVGVATDTKGNVYVTFSYDSSIRKITPAGEMTTLAGSANVQGSADGPAKNATFSHPVGLAADDAGNLYVADTENNAIRRLTPSGLVSTLAGIPGFKGSADGLGRAARFNGPTGVAVDKSGSVYVSDTGNNSIRKISARGVVSTLAGPVSVPRDTDLWYHFPDGIAADNQGTVFVADFADNTIRRITATGAVTTLAGMAGTGGSDDGAGSSALFNCPDGVAVDGAGNVYVADFGNGTIRRITPAGKVTTMAGTAGRAGSRDGTGGAAQFGAPDGVAADNVGNVYVADSRNNTIRRIAPNGVVTTLAGLAGREGSADGVGSDARFNSPFGVAVDRFGNVYVADFQNCAIRRISPRGVVTTLAGLPGVEGTADGKGSAARFGGPSSIAVDRSGNVYVADTGNGICRKITPDGVVTTLAGQFPLPDAIAVDGAGNVYVKSFPAAISKITPAGVVTALPSFWP